MLTFDDMREVGVSRMIRSAIFVNPTLFFQETPFGEKLAMPALKI